MKKKLTMLLLMLLAFSAFASSLREFRGEVKRKDYTLQITARYTSSMFMRDGKKVAVSNKRLIITVTGKDKEFLPKEIRFKKKSYQFSKIKSEENIYELSIKLDDIDYNYPLTLIYDKNPTDQTKKSVLQQKIKASHGKLGAKQIDKMDIKLQKPKKIK